MRIIISPAKKMIPDNDTLPWTALPAFMEKTEKILSVLRSMDGPSLQKLWKCNPDIASLNIERLRSMDLRRGLVPALLAYEGIQYKYMAPNVFTAAEFDYVQEHLRILSGFYGILRPFDGIRPYRLEMQAKLSVDGSKDLYGFWGSDIAEKLFSETDCIVDLASKEYSTCVSSHLRPGVRLVNCVFGELSGGKVIEKGTMCKMARGEMVRFMAENGIKDPEDMKSFSSLGYSFCSERSDENTYVFLGSENVKR